MSDFAEHQKRWHDDVAAYALDALDEREAALFEQHIHGCPECAERLRWLSPAVDVIPASVPARTPPPELRSRLMAIVEEEAVAAGADGTPAPAARRFRWLPSFDGVALRPALAGAATFLLLVAGVGGYIVSQETTTTGPPTTTYPAASEISASNATGTLRVSGDEGSLQVSNLPPTEKGQVYQAWILQRQGSVEKIYPSSVFVVDEEGHGDVSIPKGLSAADQVMVTREDKGGSDSPHENPLLVAALD